MSEYNRFLKFHLPKGQSTFFWGPRKTGKSTYLRTHFPDSLSYDLLQSDLYLKLLKKPHLLREEILSLSKDQLKHPVIIDEIQKVPMLLDEVHYLIEHSEAYFILCGSSARKLRRSGVNLLGGRAWRHAFFPLVYPEIPDFDLLHALQRGLIPSHYQTTYWQRSIDAYVNHYLIQEIQAEGLVRDLRTFAEFLEICAFSNGDLINYHNIAQDAGVDAKTIKSYYEILVDTLLGNFLEPYRPRKKKRSDITTSTPKFYLFDVGVVNALTKRSISQLKGEDAGKAFEHFILMELRAYRGYSGHDFSLTFWRKNGSSFEVDFVLGDAKVAIEVKITDNVKASDCRGLNAFNDLYSPEQSLIVCNIPRARAISAPGKQTIHALPWKTFLKRLWGGEIL